MFVWRIETCIDTPAWEAVGNDIESRKGQGQAFCAQSQYRALRGRDISAQTCKKNINRKFESGGKFEIEYIQTVRCTDAGTCPFYNEFLCKDDVCKSFDLRKFYDICEEEKSIDGYVADILLSDSTVKYSEPVLIEKKTV